MSLELPFGIKPVNPVAVDYYSGPWSGASTQEAINAANSGIPAAVRFTGLTANLVISGEAKKYWYASGISDSHLVNFGDTLFDGNASISGTPSGVAFFGGNGRLTDDANAFAWDITNDKLLVDTINATGSTLDIQFGGNTVLKNNSNFTYYYGGAGNTYILQSNNFLRPQGGLVNIDLGGVSHRWVNIYGKAIDIQTSSATGVAAIFACSTAQSANLTEWQDDLGGVLAYVDSGGNAGFKNLNVDNMTVSGTFTYVNSENVTIADKQLELASNSGTAISGDAFIDQGGIVLKSLNGDKEILWNTATNSWLFNKNITVSSAVHAYGSFQTNQGGYLNTDFINSVRSGFTGARIHLGNSVGGDDKIWLSTLQNPTLVATPSGVGLGTSTPGTALDIRANGSGIRLYKSYQDSSNYERLDLDYDHSRSYWVMQPEYQGSGTYRGLLLQSSIPGRSFLRITSGGGLGIGYGNGHTGVADHIGIGTHYIQISKNMWPTNLEADLLDLGLSSNRWKNVYSNLLNLQSIYPSEVTSTIQGASAQSANLTEWQNNAGLVLASVSSDGSIATSGDIYPYTFNQNIGIHNTNVWENIYGKHLHALDITLSGIPPGYWRIKQAGGSLYFNYNGDDKLRWRQGESFCLEGDDSFAIGNSTNVADVHLYRDAAGTWGQRDGYNSQQYNIYNYWGGDASNWERLETKWDNHTAIIQTAAAGSGVVRSLAINGDTVELQNSGGTKFQVGTDNKSYVNLRPSSNGSFELGSRFLRWKNIFANGAYHGVISISADTTLAENNNAVLCDASSGTITVTLPASANYSGIRYHIKKTDSSSNVITISPDGSETIDGQSSYVVNNQYESITLVCDGSNWFII